MPMKLTVSATRSAADSRRGSSASASLELELATALADDPARLQEKVRRLFGLVRASVADELNDGNGDGKNDRPALSIHQPSTGPALATSRGARANGVRPATPAQVKALHAITRQQGVDLRALLRVRFRVEEAGALTLQQASALIDQLKSPDDQPPAA